MRRWAALILLAGCASQGMPPGGPPDAEVPQLVQIVPEANAVNVRAPAVVLRFNEVVNERSAPTAGRPGAGGAQGLGALIQLSPSDGRDEVIWRRNVLEIRPRRGFRPNTAYRVTMLPGLADLRGNRITEPMSYVFSTGPEIPNGTITGVIFDWAEGRAATNARVEAFIAPDSTFRWSTSSDSAGRFTLSEMGAGTYEIRAWVDANNDRRISFREISEVASVTLRDTASLDLYAYIRDTLPPRLELVELVDSTAIRIRLDRGIVADWDGRSVSLFDADSVEIPLAGPFVPSAVYDSLARLRAQAARDSAAAAADTTGERTDSLTTPPAAAAAADSIAADTSAAIQRPVFRRKAPVVQWTAPLAAPLQPGEYLIRIRDAAGLNGRSVEAERIIRVQAAPAAAPQRP